MSDADGAQRPTWPQLAGWMALARPGRLSGRWRTVEGGRERAGTFVHQAPDTWFVRDDAGRDGSWEVQSLLMTQPFEREDYHRPAGPVESVVHDGHPCWQVVLEPPPHKAGHLVMVVDQVTGLRVQQRNDEHGLLVEVLGLQVDGELDRELLAAAAERQAKAARESALYELHGRRPPPSPAWFPWRRGWADRDDCWVVETDRGEGSVGRAPVGRPAPVAFMFDDDPDAVVRLDHGGWSWAVAAQPALTADEARHVVEATEERPQPADDVPAAWRDFSIVSRGQADADRAEPASDWTTDPSDEWVMPEGWDAVEAFCVTFTNGITEDELLDVLGVDRTSRTHASREQLFSGDGDHDPRDWDFGLLQVDRLGDWWMVYEDNGFFATTPGIPERLSARGTSMTLYQSVNADMDLVVAEHGRIRRRFDPLCDADDLSSPHLPGPPFAQEAGLAFGVDGAVADSITLFSRLLGNDIDASWVLDGSHDCYVRAGD